MKILKQSVFDKWDIEDKSVQAICTSPPYYSLRKYNIEDVIIGGDKDCKHEFELNDMELNSENRQGMGGGLHGGVDKFKNVHGKKVGKQGFCIHCNAWQGQHGLEPTFKLYLEHCRLWMQEAIRVLRDDGVIFINLADSYSGSNCGSNDYTSLNRCKPESYQEMYKGQKTGKQDVKPKSKLLIPERFAIMCVDELGLILRNHIVWYKPNGMPESCRDRFSKKWESIFMLTKQPKYFFNLDAIREPHAQVSIERLNRAVSNNNKWVMGADGQTPHGLSQPRPNRKRTFMGKAEDEAEIKELVSEASHKRYKERIGSMQSTDFEGGDYLVANLNPKGKNPGDCWSIPTQPSPEKHFAMWPEALVKRMILCSTKAGDTVLDCFAGSGTTLRVADKLNRTGLGIDLGYSDIQERRLSGIQKELL